MATTHFFFVAQTGAIYDGPQVAPSNYYTYRLATTHRSRVEAAIDAAPLTSAGLTYPADFLSWLSKADEVAS